MRIVGRAAKPAPSGARGRTVGLAILLVVLGCRGSRAAGEPAIIPGDHGDRIIVEVLNASGRAGLARTATRVLREAGVDVVYYGNAPATLGTLDSTRILVRRGAGQLWGRARHVVPPGAPSGHG